MTTTKLSILTRTKQLLKDRRRWTCGSLSKGPVSPSVGPSYCLMGALNRSYSTDAPYVRYPSWLNDEEKKAVEELYDAALALDLLHRVTDYGQGDELLWEAKRDALVVLNDTGQYGGFDSMHRYDNIIKLIDAAILRAAGIK